MLRRTRTTKTLARRIDLQYFTRPHPFRRWRFWLSVAVPLIALGWLFTLRVQGGQKAYSSGPLSQAHAAFTPQCNLCHVGTAGSFTKNVSDDACRTCHDAPIHQASQTFRPACSSCHLEHKGALRLAATSDGSCTQCHAKLETRAGLPHYAGSITRFDKTHPEFAPIARHMSDPGQIRLNHYLHLQPNLIGPQNRRVQMTCDDCHRTSDALDAWPYAAATSEVKAPDEKMHGLERTANIMMPIRFSAHCSGCHTLQFDRRFGDLQVPHDRPDVVHAFITSQFKEYVAKHPDVIHETEPPNRQLPEEMQARPIARNADEWVLFRVQEAEWLLWSKTCKQCHMLTTTAAAALPEVAKSNITARWLPHAEFDHRAHRAMSCVACHSKAPESHDTADLLLPSIKVCQQCHRESAARDTAESRCFECHQYHDWSRARRIKGRFSIPELRGTAQLHLPN